MAPLRHCGVRVRVRIKGVRCYVLCVTCYVFGARVRVRGYGYGYGYG